LLRGLENGVEVFHFPYNPIINSEGTAIEGLLEITQNHSRIAQKYLRITRLTLERLIITSEVLSNYPKLPRLLRNYSELLELLEKCQELNIQYSPFAFHGFGRI
jgi:hypothetical protein